MKRAFITGITGQDGSYLAELLLEKGYEVHGLVRRTSSMERSRIDPLRQHDENNGMLLNLHYGDLSDYSSLLDLLNNIQPDEIYNLAAQSHVRISFDTPESTTDITATGTVRLLEAVRRSGLINKTRFYQASSSEMFGKVTEMPQSELTPFHPRSPYACAKAHAHWITINYREAYGLYACCGILFNHESPRRGENFVTRKISQAAGRIKAGLQDKITMGTLDAKKDWGYAKEYVVGMWQMLQQDEADDYILATGEPHSVEEFLEASFQSLDLDWRDYYEKNTRFLRPSEVEILAGDYSKAKKKFGWEPETRMKELAELMTAHDYELAKKEAGAGNDSKSVE
jgi:GDPmannose 4,6-dehydratase